MDIEEIKKLMKKFDKALDDMKWSQDYWGLVCQYNDVWELWVKLKPKLDRLVENVKVN